MEAIRFSHQTLSLLDQTALPEKEIWLDYTTYQEVQHAISTMVVRGAPAIGIAAAYAVVLAAQQFASVSDEVFSRKMTQAIADLNTARPTAVNLSWALQRMHTCLCAVSNRSAVVDSLLQEATAIHQEDIAMNQRIGAFGAQVVPDHAGVLTHCNAGALATGGYGTALGVIRTAYAQGRIQMVYADETRPLLQGARLTAYELQKDQIPVTVITDSMAGAMMAAGKIQMVVLGCDRMAANGDFANKIGTYSLAVLAQYHGIPFYTALPVSTIDFSISDGSQIIIEERAAEEVLCCFGRKTTPSGTLACNPAFDITPHHLLTGIITDHGVLYPPFDRQL
ncbi:MAG: S-methyl-5-thioribose-1-phosphate isomerase, partial [Oscillospiraceae bacterium]|nr:S-methyl-5-thioribose-1-phosphate isomerase [Oscillospiraceae bacterium]